MEDEIIFDVERRSVEDSESPTEGIGAVYRIGKTLGKWVVCVLAARLFL